MTSALDIRDHIENIARRLLGEPNHHLSTRAQLRFGSNGSVAVEIAGPKRGQWYDHEGAEGGGPWELLTIKGGMSNGAAVDWLRSEIGVDIAPAGNISARIIATYDYRDERGELLFQVVRFEPKAFRQRRPDGEGGWTWSVRGTRQVPYCLPELIATPPDAPVFIVEGEKDVDRLRKLGLTATCNPGGAAKRRSDGKPAKLKWRPEYNPFFRGRNAIVIPDNDDTGRDHASAVAANLARVGVRVRILELPSAPAKCDVSDWLDAGGTREKLEELASAALLFRRERGAESTSQEPKHDLVIDASAPYTTAKLFVERYFTTGEKRTLHRYRGAFHRWNGVAYAEIGENKLRAQLYAFLDQCVTRRSTDDLRPVKPNATTVGHVLDALRAASDVDDSIQAPAWLDHVPDLPAAEIVACANGLLHLPTLRLVRHTPNFFTNNAIDFAYDPGAPSPTAWLQFLDQLWPDDRQSIELLQEIFGYCLTADTRQQKAFLLVGPKRSGKGTIARVLTRLIGPENAVAPTLAGLGMNFGLAPLIGKRLAIISDARLGSRADQHALAERLLSITGEDAITIDRKFMPAWTGRLQTRFVILSNELPRLVDASGALASRFIVLVLTRSFYGKEDHSLTDCLLAELPGILNWSIAGLRRLRDRGHFLQPSSAAEVVQYLEDLGSPITAFLRERCVIATGRTVKVNRLFEVWGEWCKQQGRDHPGTAQIFGRDLRAAVPGLKTSNLRGDDDKRHRNYDGIGLR
jgi:putative DNA primase/helicase